MKPLHSMIRVLDREKSVNFYREYFAMEISYEIEREDFILVYLRNPEVAFELELTINKGREQAYTHGESYGHMAFSCPNLEESHARFQADGLAPGEIKSFEDGGRLFARFFFVQDPDGYKIEIIEQSGRFDY